MSYILDALKKVERERARARHPMVEVAGAQLPARRRLWPWAVAGALVLNAAVAGVVVLRWPSDPTAEPDRTVAVTPEATVGSMPALPQTRSSPAAPPARRHETPTAPTPPEPAVAGAAAAAPEPALPPPRVQTPPPPRRPEPESVPRVDVPPPRVDTPTARPGSSPPEVGPTVTPPARAISPAQDAAPPAKAATAAPPITTPGVDPQPAAPPARPSSGATTARPPESARSRSASDLPPAFQTAVSSLKLEVLLYGTAAADRMVFINGRKYVEGQSLDGEVVVERITAEGVVLAHAGRRFLLTPSR